MTANQLLAGSWDPGRPPCYNRPPFAEGRWHDTGRRSASGKPVLRWHPRWFEQRCATWDGVGIGPVTHQYPQGLPYPLANGYDCSGCKWRPVP